SVPLAIIPPQDICVHIIASLKNRSKAGGL
ncbi:MAG: hypothetical protein ACI9Y8_002028, partial [Candidatus Omnitrophota bacterium]